MTFEADYRKRQKIYLVNDPEQVEYRLNRITFDFSGGIFLELFCPSGELMEVPEEHTSKKRNIAKMLESATSKDDEEE